MRVQKESPEKKTILKEDLDDVIWHACILKKQESASIGAKRKSLYEDKGFIVSSVAWESFELCVLTI